MGANPNGSMRADVGRCGSMAPASHRPQITPAGAPSTPDSPAPRRKNPCPDCPDAQTPAHWRGPGGAAPKNPTPLWCLRATGRQLPPPPRGRTPSRFGPPAHPPSRGGGGGGPEQNPPPGGWGGAPWGGDVAS